MRPKIVLGLLLFASLVLGAAFFLKKHAGNTDQPVAISESATPAPVMSVKTAAPVAPVPAPPVVAPVVVTQTVTPEEQEAAIESETERLDTLAMGDDPTNLPPILEALTSPEKEIRDAAIEAAIQFGSRDAISALQAVAANTADPEEKAALLDAADFLALPSITEVAASMPPPTPEEIQADQQKAIDRQNRFNQLHPRPAAQQLPGSPNSPSAPGN